MLDLIVFIRLPNKLLSCAKKRTLVLCYSGTHGTWGNWFILGTPVHNI